ncbi:hypothetical protein [Bdellovibrio sp. BCCA]
MIHAIIPATKAEFDDFEVERGVSYTYRIQAADAAGNISEYSLPLTITP